MTKLIRSDVLDLVQGNWRLLHVLQGNLKDLSQENYERLKRVFVKHGFSSPFQVWNHEGVFHLLDGTQRFRTLTQMEKEGYEIPPTLPFVVVKARDEKEAREKLAAFASQYGEVTSQGLYEFMTKSEIAFEDAKDLLRFPEIKFEKFGKEFFETSGEDEEESESEETKVKKPLIAQCPNCGDCFDANENKPLQTKAQA